MGWDGTGQDRTGFLCSRSRGVRRGWRGAGVSPGGAAVSCESLSSSRLSVRRLRGHWLSADVPCSPSDVALHERGHFVPDGAAVTQPAALQAKKTAPDYLH